jgi:DNA-binding MarR family transcriptional regulator
VGHLLRRAYAIAKANTTARLKAFGITPMQAAAIMALRRDGAVSQADLGRAIGMEPANVHGLIARLQKQELVETAPHPTDQRQLLVRLSIRGERSADVVALASGESATQTLAVLAEEERHVFLSLLTRIVTQERLPTCIEDDRRASDAMVD